ncbi:MAG: DUF2628 domain-containing protein [Clostridia bacterium]|nr:DUF2628 domain-containing protein [Clostridia bacterium]
MIPISYVDEARSCVTCGEPFSAEDDVVFCPDCGAPHHRACWQAEGHCHHADSHGTEDEWTPAAQTEEVPEEAAEQPTPSAPHTIIYMNGIAMVKCPACGKITRVYPTKTTCNHCQHPIEGIPQLSTVPLSFGETALDVSEPIDGIDAKKFAKMVLHKATYYLPRFRNLKAQGKGIVSWNWAAFFLAPYWLAFRKCYVWAASAAFFDLLSVVFMVPLYQQVAPFLEQGYEAYVQAMPQPISEISIVALLAAQVAMLLLVARAIIFGLFGNYIYKKECMRRIERLDALPPDEANALAIRLGGVNFFMPLVLYYLINIAKNLILSFLT